MRGMPHRSRLAVVLLDLPPETHDAGRDFWSAATGRPAPTDPDEPEWSSLGNLVDGWHVSVQRTGEGTPARWHVDVETDDVDAEVARLLALSARRHADMGGYWQLLDPAGLVFCVVPVQDAPSFEKYAVSWS